MKATMTIGFFDSGVGGFHVMERVMQHMPDYSYAFYGDTKHVPYGDKKEEEIYRLTRNAVWYLFSAHNAQIVILACNTASAQTLRRLQDEFLVSRYPNRRVLGVIIPTVEEVVSRGYKKPLLIGTTRTINSGKYDQEFKKFDEGIVLRAEATSQLVPLIESGKLDEACQSLEALFLDHVSSGGDSIILGCTHYALLTPLLRARYGSLVSIISQEEIIPHKLADYLARHPEIESSLSRKRGREVVWSGEVNPQLIRK
ncbi:glutamate racemase [Patescibacteria group bacterium]|nr:glutamate racemase [Patescibacteria group bacterium]